MTRRFLPTLLLAILPIFPAQASWDEGVSAYLRADWPKAAAELKPLAEAGDLRAQGRYGHLLLHGWGVPRNEAEGLRLIQSAADQSDAAGTAALADARMAGLAGLPRNPSLGVTLFRRAADLGDAEAEYRLGSFQILGIAMPKDTTSGLAALQRAAAAGWAQSWELLGEIYLSGLGGVPMDQQQALLWLRKAAETGLPTSQMLLSDMLLKDVATRDEALRWLHQAVDKGLPAAMGKLGVLQINGESVPRDVTGGMELLRRAADSGDTHAMENLGRLFWYGGPLPKDHGQAVPWLRKGADNGSLWSTNSLAMALLTGDGIAKNPAEAVSLFRRAADKGFPSAQFNLGELYRAGQGVERDFIQSYAWLIQAANGATPADKAKWEAARDRAADLLLPSEAERARAMAASHSIAAVSPPPVPQGLASAPQRSSAGSGFFVAHNGTVLTNAHVVPQCHNVRVTPSDTTKSVEASVLAIDTVNDLAVLKTGLNPHHIARFREDKPLRSGDGVVVIGYPLSSLLSREPNVTAGIISAMAGPRGDARFFQITAPVQKGNSGGPLADMSGNVVGVVSRKLNAMQVQKEFDDLPQNVNFAIKSEFVRKFLADSAIPQETGSAKEALSTADVGDRIKAVTVFIECLP